MFEGEVLLKLNGKLEQSSDRRAKALAFPAARQTALLPECGQNMLVCEEEREGIKIIPNSIPANVVAPLLHDFDNLGLLVLSNGNLGLQDGLE